MNQNNQGGGHDGANGNNNDNNNAGTGPGTGGGGASRLQPHQATKLVLAYQNEMRQARAPGVDPAKAQEHLNRAEQIKLILVKYQQQRAKLQQQQQQQQQQPQQQQGGPNQGLQGLQEGLQLLPQSLPQMGNNMNFQQQQQLQASSVPQRLTQSAQSPQMMASSPGMARTPKSAMGSPMMGGNQQQNNLQMRAATSSQLQSIPQGSNRPLSQQQQLQVLQGGNKGQFPSTANNNSNSNSAAPSTAESNFTIEKFNLLKTKYEEVNNLLQQCEKRKQLLQNPAEVEKIDGDINHLKERSNQLKKLLLHVRSQLIARQNANNAAAAGQTQSGTAAGALGFQQNMANNAGQRSVTGTATAPTGAARPPMSQQPTAIPPNNNQARVFPPQQQVTTPGAPVSATPRQLPPTANQQINNTSVPTSGQSSPPPVSMGGVAEANKSSLPPGGGQKSGSVSNSVSATGTPGSSTGGKQLPKPTTTVGQQPGRPSPAPNPALANITRSSVPLIPISNTISVKPPQPVTLKQGSSRPTITGGVAVGMGQILGTPAITKLPTFELASGSGAGGTIQDNGGRVLTKRKLSELVNTIGADEGDGKTVIDGDVEELLLDLADEFISSVTSFACRLAKHRKVDTLDVRDVQLHLERNWNIRIPGYAMDEIKATRKWQPSTAYNQKLQGVEIAKSVNGNLK